MSKKRLGSGLPDHLGPLRAHLLHGKALTPKQEELRRQIDVAWTLLLAGYSRSHCIQMLSDRLSIKKSRAYQLIDDTFILYGDIAESRKEGLRYLMTEQLQNIAHRAKFKGDLKNQIRALEMICQINELNSGDKENQLPVLMPIIFTNDPSALKKQVEDTEILPDNGEIPELLPE